MEDTPDEPGASRHRFQVERIDPQRGTATGYVAKYVAKGID
ncbi:replication endonuclease [Aquisalimonas lutea]|nr:replication endonuclease [Aquisalimonas lutea]MDN3519113.1 replication endonuclease [Aquisalimonas lutea]